MKKVSVTLGALALVAIAGQGVYVSSAEAANVKYCVCHEAGGEWVQARSDDVGPIVACTDDFTPAMFNPGDGTRSLKSHLNHGDEEVCKQPAGKFDCDRDITATPCL